MQETFPAAPEALAQMRAFVRHALAGASPEESEVLERARLYGVQALLGREVRPR